jgi:hypothetical protein
MADDRKFKDEDTSLDPEDVNSGPSAATPEREPVERRAPDPNDAIPVPPVITAAEIDERGKVVEALRDEAEAQGEKRGDETEKRRDHDSGMR